MPRITKERMVGVLGEAPRPPVVWQRQFDGCDHTLIKLAEGDWYDATAWDLSDYIMDMTYQELQPDLFRHVFPACLRFWRDSLMRNEAAAGEGDFHHALLHGNIFSKMMTATETQRTFDFFADALLDRMDLECTLNGDSGSTFGWIGRFNTLGLFEQALPKVWREWWRADRPAMAVCVVQYASGLVYFPDENPIYAEWTCDTGGGGPYLTAWDCSVFDHPCLPSNIGFLRETLTVDYVIERLEIAAATLADTPLAPMARTVAAAACGRREMIALRIDDILDQFGRLDPDRDLWDRSWSHTCAPGG